MQRNTCSIFNNSLLSIYYEPPIMLGRVGKEDIDLVLTDTGLYCEIHSRKEKIIAQCDKYYEKEGTDSPVRSPWIWEGDIEGLPGGTDV